MTAPSQTAFTVLETNSDQTTVTLTVPSHAEGDALVIFYGFDNDSGAITHPSGYDEEYNDNVSQTSVACATKIATASEPATIDPSWANSERSIIGMASIDDVDQTTPVDTLGSGNSGSDQTAECLSLTTGVDECLVYGHSSANRNRYGTEDTGYESGWTGVYARRNVGSGDNSSALMYKSFASAGATGDATHTMDQSFGGWGTRQIAFAPVVGGAVFALANIAGL